MAMLTVNGVEVKCPSEWQYSLQDISMSDAGRDESGLMYAGKIGTKRKIQLAWWAPTPSETSAILKAFSSTEYLEITYPDALDNEMQTRTFYVGDRTAPMYWWHPGHERYSKISFDIIER